MVNIKAQIKKRIGNFALVIFGFSFIMLCLTLAAQWTADTSFMPWSNYISDLSVGPNLTPMFYHSMLIGLGILTIFFSIFYRNLLLESGAGKTSTMFILVFVFLCDIALFVMPFFPLDFSQPRIAQIHLIFGFATFITLGGFMVLNWFSNRKTNLFPKFLNLLSLSGGLVNIIFGILLFLVEITHTLNRNVLIYLIEWIGFFSYAVWLLIAGLLLRK